MKAIWNIALILTMAAATACGNRQTTTTVTFEKAKASKQVQLSGEQEAPTCTVELNVDYATDGNNAETAKAINDAIQLNLFNMKGLSMQQAVDSFANQYTHDYLRDLKPLYEQDTDDELKRAWYEYNYSIDTQTLEGWNGDVVVYLITQDYYEGGAHGISQQLTMNFDKLSGRQLQLKDVFVPGYEARLTELLLKKLMQHVDVSTMEELRDKGYLFSMDMFPTENFMLGEDHITFIYNVYEIAAYAMGSTELEVEYDEVKDLMKK
jgi:hypothetical protein